VCDACLVSHVISCTGTISRPDVIMGVLACVDNTSPSGWDFTMRSQSSMASMSSGGGLGGSGLMVRGISYDEDASGMRLPRSSKGGFSPVKRRTGGFSPPPSPIPGKSSHGAGGKFYTWINSIA
jgi:hypothetical protein